jgi:hypothetical protein
MPARDDHTPCNASMGPRGGASAATLMRPGKNCRTRPVNVAAAARNTDGAPSQMRCAAWLICHSPNWRAICSA